MPKNPLGNLPLSISPYWSRITAQYGSENKNYYMVGFTPGYALQASELNEIQELFFINHSLSIRHSPLWVSEGYTSPFWEGIVPFTPTLVGATAQNSGNLVSINVKINPGWYLWTDKESYLSFWIYLDEVVDETFTTTNAQEYIGFVMTKSTVLCCPTAACEEGRDETLRDNSQGNTENFFTCGASRLKVSFGELVIRTELGASDFYPILTVNNNQTTPEITYIDEQPVPEYSAT